MKELNLEIETLEKPLHVSSPLGTRVRVDQICQDCELEISGILLDECLKHSSYTRVGLSFSSLFYIIYTVFVARLMNWCLF